MNKKSRKTVNSAYEAGWRVLFAYAVDDQFARWWSQSPDDRRAWIRRWLPDYIVNAIPHLPPDQRAKFIVSEVRRRFAEMGMLHYAAPWDAIKRNAERTLNGHKTRELWDIALPVWAMNTVKRDAGTVKNEGVVARIEAESKTRGVDPPTKAAVKRAIDAELHRRGVERRRGRPKKK